MPIPTPPEYGLQTMDDRAIDEAMRLRANVDDIAREARSTGAPPTLGSRIIKGGAVAGAAGAVRYEELCRRHPDYMADYWAECRALYAGGSRLLRDRKLLERLFPKHEHEAGDIYGERLNRAFYIPYAGEVIDLLLAGFAEDPIRLSAGTSDKGDELKLPDWWGEFVADVSPPGGERCGLGRLAVDLLREAFQVRCAWALVDLPKYDPDMPAPESRLEEEAAGLRDPYICVMPAECVVDWEEDEETHELRWLLCYWRTCPRESLTDKRELVHERWLYWTPEEWTSYRAVWNVKHPPLKDDMIAVDETAPHAMGRVPFVRLTLPEGMWAMGKMHSLAREHLNKRSAVAWAEYKSLFSQLYEFNQTHAESAFNPMGQIPVPGAPPQATDPHRAVNQLRGQGYVQIRGDKDRAEFIGPDTTAFKEARGSCTELMQEIHRVMFSMALSADMGTAALKRSGESKEKDAASIAVILTDCGERVRDAVRRILDLVRIARSVDEGGDEIEPVGAAKFDAQSVAAAIAEAVEFLNGVPQRSPTFSRIYLYRIYKMLLGSEVAQKDLDLIKTELELAITAEALMLGDPNVPMPKKQGDEDEDEEDDDAPPAPKNGKPGRRQMYP